MHGRPRKAPSPVDSAASIAKSAKLRDLQAQFLHNHLNKLYTKEAVEESRKLVEINPEVYTAWNYRKLALDHNLDGVEDPVVVKGLVDEELRTVEMALRVNHKSYGAWYHRKWVLSRRLSEIDFNREFRLMDQLLKADPRNFHGWNYRRFIAKLKSVPEADELEHTLDMINTNFSNYSAWHNRSAILSQLLKQRAEGFDRKESILTEEYELVRQALFTDPSDQSGWFYHLWLLDQTVTLDNSTLISSWPKSQSNWVLSSNKDKKSFKLFPASNSNLYYSLNTNSLPIILYFNQAVGGLDSSTVTVNSVFAKNEDLIWIPLTTTKSREAHSWVTYIKMCDEKFSVMESSTFEVSVSCSSGHFAHPFQFKFTITVKSIEIEKSGDESVDELFVWNAVNKELEQRSASHISFDKLSITEEYVPQTLKWNLETLSNEIDLFKELSDDDCKFVKLTLARLLIAQDALMSCGNLLTKRAHYSEVIELFDDLVKLDPSHARYYEDERSVMIMNQATFDKELECTELPSSGLLHVGLRLSRLSLTRLGRVEHLLWVQVLDLSHNELRCIEGLEALQLLVCLNLSNNRISSCTALEPLKLLKSLRILNISSNLIGSHSVDTSRYLCSSPLSHTKDAEQIIEQLQKDNIRVGDYWEAILLFTELNLVQLEISGNSVANNEAFRDLLMKVVPTLKWLDGVHRK